MKVLVIQHEISTPPGSLIKWLSKNNYDYRIIFFSENPSYSDFEFDLLVVLGGGMNVDQEDVFPWLRNEKEFIRNCIKIHKKIIGLCLGGQLLAEILGAKVFKAEKWELGWHEVIFTESNEKLYAFHWHGYQFTLPKNAKRLCSSLACPNQAFTVGNNILGTQFHPEADDFWINYNLENSKMPDVDMFVQSKSEIIKNMHHQAEMENWFFLILDQFVSE